MGYRAVFLDRDGTLNEEVGYVNHLDRFWLLPRTAQAVRLLNRHGFKTFVVTNQSGVARGYFPESLVHLVHQKMKDLLSAEGAVLDGVYTCPHHPDVGDGPYRQRCLCRKPGTGMIQQAMKEFDIDCSRSYTVGDRGVDVELSDRIGAKGILVLTGYGKGEWQYARPRWKARPAHVAADLYEAVQWILRDAVIEVPRSREGER